MIPSLETRRLVVQFVVHQYRVVSIFLVVVILSIGWMVVVRPLGMKIQGIREEIRETKRQVGEKERIVQAMEQTLAEVQSVSLVEKEKVRKAILERVDYPSLWVYFSAIGEDAGVDLQSISLIPLPAEEAGIAPIQARVIFDGSGYSTMKRILKNMEKGIPLIDVISFSFEPKDESIQFTVALFQIPQSE